ncbi:hypothetical protein [Stackebrandtia soli]|uniref:hypothetical protein n=1 Tax=Stackebrandtia soli TaxID=1892856 RepID=UPI0039EAE399
MRDLVSGARLRTSSGTWVQATALAADTRPTNTYNLSVSQTHTYYVEAAAADVLVHNCETGTVWDDIKGTQDPIPGTGGIPKSFELTAGDTRASVHPNVTKHFVEKLTPLKREGASPEMIGLASQQLLRSLQAVVTDAIRGGVPLAQRMFVQGWQLEFNQRPSDELPALMHGKYKLPI